MQFPHLTTDKKLKYYYSDLYKDLQSARIPLLILVSAIILIEIIQALIIPPEATTFTSVNSLIIWIPFIGTCLCYYLSVIKPVKSNSTRVIKPRDLILFLGILIFAAGIFAGTLRADKSLDISEFLTEQEYIASLLDRKSELWIIILADLIIPIWHLKLLIPLGFWAAMLVQYYDIDTQYTGVLWTKCIFAFMYLSYMFALKGYMQWKKSVKTLNTETLCEVQKSIIDTLPDAVGILNEESQIIYSNANLKALCNSNLKELSQRVVEVSRVAPLRHIRKETVEVLADETKQTFLNDEGKKLETTNINFASGNFNDLLTEAITLLNDNNANSQDYIILSGRYLVDSCTTHSCEIKLSHLINTKMIIVIFTDTVYKDQVAALEEVNQYKDTLLATVSHDLRAPINGTITFIENTLENEDVPAQVKQQYLIPAQRSGQFLIHLVNDILDFCQFNVQKLRMNFESVSIVDTLKNCHQLLEIQAKQKKILFILEIDDDLPPVFTTDHNRLSQIIINLLTNALKFTVKGEVRLSATLVDLSVIEIKVTDTGVGMKEEDQKKLFTEFTRIQSDTPHLNPKGIGLGLVIANRLAKMIGPDEEFESGIKVQSEFGEGSTFSFLIKDNTAAKEKSLKEEARLKSRSSFYSSLEQQARLKSRFEIQLRKSFSNQRTGEILSLADVNATMAGIPPYAAFSVRNPNLRLLTHTEYKHRALIVDDDPFNVLALEAVLKKFGLGCDLAYNGEEAVNKFIEVHNEYVTAQTYREEGYRPMRSYMEVKYDIIFMDVEMPIMNGIESTIVLNRMMKNGNIKSIPIIGCTGHRDYDNMERCFEAGMADVITKPVSREKLKECLNYHLDIEG